MRKMLIGAIVVFGLGSGILAAALVGSSGATDPTGTGSETVAETTEPTGRDWTEYAETNGVEAALAQLVADGLAKPTFAGSCHTVAHEIGQVAASQVDLRTALELEPGSCLNGYTHGLLQVLAVKPDTKFSELLDACAKAKAGEMATECVHGVGHLLALRHPSSLKSSLEECLTIEASLHASCVGGTMMEYGQNLLAKKWPDAYSEINRTMGPDKPTEIDLSQNEIESPCLLVPEVSLMYQCWTEMGPFIIAQSNSLEDSAGMADRCRSEEEKLQWGCLYSLFAWIMDDLDEGGDNPTELAETVTSLCGEVAADLRDGCLNGVLYRIGLPRDIEVAEAVCGLLEAGWDAGCRAGVETARDSHRNSGIVD